MDFLYFKAIDVDLGTFVTAKTIQHLFKFAVFKVEDLVQLHTCKRYKFIYISQLILMKYIPETYDFDFINYIHLKHCC